MHALSKVYLINIYMETRKLCPKCQQRPVAINYRRGEVIHYRSVCDVCNRAKNKLRFKAPSWLRAGYEKKPQCERCGFRAKIPEQLIVFYADGNLKNNAWVNLKTICLNCQQEIFKSKLGWRPEPLVPDF